MHHRNPRSGKLGLKLIIILVVLLGGGGFAAVRFTGWPGGLADKAEATAEEKTGAEEEEEAEEGPPQTVNLGEFLVNIRAGGNQLRYLKAEMSLVVHELECKGKKHKKKRGHGGSGESEAELPAACQSYARDVAVAVLSNQQFETLRTAEGKSKVKATLQQKLNAVLEEYRVSDILFTAFVMQ